jgi:putative DNA primase/helicase
MVPIKNNLARDSSGMAYRIADSGAGPYIEWEADAINITADELLNGTADDGDGSRANDAKQWLTDLLLSGPVTVKEIQAGAKAAGLSWRTVERAKAAMGAIASHDGGAGGAGKWVWKLAQGKLT